MPFDQLKQLADLLTNLEAQLTGQLQGEPYQGFDAALRVFRQELQNAGAEIQAATPQVAPEAAPADEESTALEQLLAGGELCLGIDHMPGLKTEANYPPDIRTPMDVVEKLLELATVCPADTVYDLGCGDGRFAVSAAANYGARAVGIDLLPERVELARLHARLKQVEALAQFHAGNVLDADLTPATVVVLSVSKGTMLRMRDKLREQLPVGARIVSHAFDLGDWRPRLSTVLTDAQGCKHRAFLWIVDERRKASDQYGDDWEFWDDWVSEYQ